jgi:O-antigen ligase
MNKFFKFLIFIFVLSLPWQTRWIFFDFTLAGQIWQYGRLSLYLSWLVLILAAIVFLFKHPQERHWSKQKPIYLLIAYCLLSLFWSPLKVVSSYYLALFFSAVLASYLLSKDKKTTQLAFITAGFMQAVFAIWQFFQQEIISNKWLGIAGKQAYDLGASVIELGDQRWLRAYGALPHPNILGGFLTLAIIFSLGVWWQIYQQGEKEQWSKKFIKKTWWHLGLLMVAIVSQSIALSLSFSRSAVLALLLSIMLLLFVALKNKQALLVNILVKYFAILFLVLFITNWYLPNSWQQRILGQGRLENISTQERIASIKQISWSDPKAIILGQGLGINSYQAWRQAPSAKVYDFQPIHNVYLLALAEVGIVGVLILFFIVWKYFYKKYKLDYISLALIIAVLVIALFDHYLWTGWTGLLLVALVLSRLKDKSKI